ncbi:hypothetical protein FITA111629_08385 [Filibacter tadaridae]|uniref:Uncharacterized protein n=1 Tax=Filibacter tadaridae TaxID=2483811 RepID=A0A3P5XBV9_9BACL|nr:hypothetical protein [Filibacter tadaridae]VDC25957.1 hypothetical protein FILTAD_01382 [Filibacter tadaridae]
MKREKKRLLLVSAAVVLGMSVWVPTYISASAEQTGVSTQIAQTIKGTVLENWGSEIIINGDDGERYHIGLHTFTEEQIQAMNLSVGALVQIEGEVLESFSDFYDFNFFAKSLPSGVTEDDLKVLETLYNQVMALEKDERWEETGEVWMQINEITNPYYLANWEPEPFDAYISMFEYMFTNEDLAQLESLYNQWIALSKKGLDEESGVKMDQFFEIVNNYYVEPTFEEYLKDLEITISEEDYSTIKQLYQDALQATKDGNHQLAMEKWDDFDLAMRPYYRTAYPMPTFEEQMAYYDFEVSEEDLLNLKEIYTAILDGELNANYEQEASLWESFNTILEPYFTTVENIPYRASQVKVNGKTYSG